MGILDAPGVTQGQLALLGAGWSVVSSRPVKTGDSATFAVATSSTTRLSEVAPYALTAVRLVYANWQNAFSSAEGPNYNAYRVKCAVHKAGTAAPDRAVGDWLAPATFAGREYGLCAPGQLLLSDPIPVGLAVGERWWHESYVDTNLGAGPPAPTLTGVAGSNFAAGNAYVQVTYVYPDGSESLPSAETLITTAAGSTSIQVTAPAAVVGAIGWRAYLAQAPAAAGAVKYESLVSPMAALGTNITLTSLSGANATFRLTRLPTNVGYPLGRGLQSTVGQGSLGEAQTVSRDYTNGATVWTGSASFAGVFSPIAVLGVAADGLTHRSVALLGDSIQAGTGDTGYGAALGGSGFRACANQIADMRYDPTKTPAVGFMTLAQGGETLGSFVTPAGGARRRSASEMATTIVDNYGTNDTGSGSALIYANMLAVINYYAGRKRYFHNTIDPKTTSTDGWQTIANQSIASTDAEADRRAINNCLLGSTGAVAVSGEALLRSQGTAVSSTNLYSGADGTTRNFAFAFPFLTGSETVQVNGVTKAVTTDYTYRFTAVINGQTYASGINFGTAPASGLSVTASYTKIASFGAVAGFTGVIDTTAAVEVNGSGVAGTNGGFWKAAVTAGGFTSTVSSASGAVLNDTTGSAWTADQWRGFCVLITADATTPASVGQLIAIKSNTVGVLNLAASWATAPSAGASYLVYRPLVIDGTHNTSHGALLKSQLIDTTRF